MQSSLIMKGVPLGFDLRLRAEDYVGELWSSEQRGQYLLREDVNWPMSVDRSVWPSLLQSHYFERGRRIVNPRFLDQDTSDLENDFGMIRDAESLIRLPGAQLGVAIGVQVLHDESKGNGHFFGIESSSLPPEAELLGLDVANSTPISGLSGCGYKQQEVSQLRAAWGHKLNQHGLLESIDDAMQFREMTNRRVPEHAPFYIYKLFAVRP